MNPKTNKTLLAVMDDLFFRVKIEDAAKRSGFASKFVGTEQSAAEQIAQQPPDVMVVDLNCKAVDPLRLIALVKHAGHANIPVIGFISHVEVGRRKEAENGGYDVVFARSALDANLPALLAKYASL